MNNNWLFYLYSKPSFTLRETVGGGGGGGISGGGRGALFIFKITFVMGIDEAACKQHVSNNEPNSKFSQTFSAQTTVKKRSNSDSNIVTSQLHVIRILLTLHLHMLWIYKF